MYTVSPVISVTEVNQLVQHLLQECCDTVTVEGEISNFHAHRSGHWYFTLKDDQAQIRISMFSRANRQVPIRPQDGDLVQITGQLSLYAARGDFQLIANALQPVGEGALQAQQQALLKKIHQLGWSDDAHKKALPLYPEHIGVITAPGSAAMHDIISTLADRWPCAKVSLFPTLVQGIGSVENLIQALKTADLSECDVLILARGGGSLEDLWSFNEWAVIECVFQINTPLITGVGHETDTTLVDVLADVRAPTPTGAAVLSTPDAPALQRTLKQTRQQYQQRWLQVFKQSQNEFKALCYDCIDNIHAQLNLARAQQTEQMKLCSDLMQHHFKQSQFQLQHQAGLLEAHSPLKILSRGYCWAEKSNKQPITRANQLSPGDCISLTFQDGQVKADVIDTDY